jgi:RimJ/RimL family protein N-acetyltransferase
MASELTSRARASGEVAKVVAHTRAEDNASDRILRRIGLVRVGEQIDSDDGPIWRWET